MKEGTALFEVVREHYLFAGLSQQDFDALVGHMTPRKLKKGETLFHRGDVSDYFYFVDTGHIELSLVAKTGEKKTLEVIGPGRSFAEAVAFMRGRKYPVSAEAISDCTLCQIPNQAYMTVLKSDTDACMRLLADISRHLHARVNDIEKLTIQNARSRLISYLLDRIENKAEDQATIQLELPKHVIASRLSIKPETLSRLLRNLNNEGLITIEDSLIFIPSLEKLRPYD
ncbi:MAG: Crp/Fnr family transcriptional regulator [Gammaproteobacteria bacterium]|nr:Crp/Fnr family transcriptional regulator [Gammaproteobacteria bacterium]